MSSVFPLPIIAVQKIYSWLLGGNRKVSTVQTARSTVNGPFTPYVSNPSRAKYDDSGSFAGKVAVWESWLHELIQFLDRLFDLTNLFADPFEAPFFVSVLALFAIHSLERKHESQSVRETLLTAFPLRYRSSMTGIAAIVDWHVKYKALHVDRAAVSRLRFAWKKKHGGILGLRKARYITLWIVYQVAAFVRTKDEFTVSKTQQPMNVLTLMETIRSRDRHPAYFLIYVADRRASMSKRDQKAACILINASHGHIPSSSRHKNYRYDTVQVPGSANAFVMCGLNSCELPKNYLYRITRDKNRVIRPEHNYTTTMIDHQHFSESTENFNFRTTDPLGPGQPHAIALDPRFLSLVDRIQANQSNQTCFVYQRTRFQVFQPNEPVPNVHFDARGPTQGIRIFKWNQRYPSFTAYDENRRKRQAKSLWEGKKYTLRNVFSIVPMMCKTSRPVYVVSHSCLNVRPGTRSTV